VVLARLPEVVPRLSALPADPEDRLPPLRLRLEKGVPRLSLLGDRRLGLPRQFGVTIRARTSPRLAVEPSRTSTSETRPPVSVERTASREDFTVPAETAAVISSTRPGRTRKTSTGIVPEIL